MIQVNGYGAAPVVGVTAATAEANTGFRTMMNTNSPKSMDDIFKQAAETYQIPENLLKAVAEAESDFQTDEVSHSGAMGVMQLMPETAKYLGVNDPFDAEQNIMGGAKYLSEMLKKYDGDVKLALAAYNAGPGNVKKYGGVPPFTETQNYVVKVMRLAGGVVDVPQNASVKGSGRNSNSAVTPGLPMPTAADLFGNVTQSMSNFQSYSMEDYNMFLQMFLSMIMSKTTSNDATSSLTDNSSSGMANQWLADLSKAMMLQGK